MSYEHGLCASVPPVVRTSPPASGSRDVRRWLLLVLILGFGVVLVFSRQQLGTLLSTLQKDLGLASGCYAMVSQAFMIASTVGALLMGASCCLIGTRWTYGIIIAGSLIAAVITGLASGLVTLIAGRVLLGLVTGGGTPAAIQAVGECVPRKAQAIAVALLTISTLGTTLLGTPAIASVSSEFGLRAVFFVTASVCVFWLLLWGVLALWAWLSPYPVVPGERIADGFSALKKWQSWAYVGARLLVDPLYLFLLYWAPECMRRTFGMSAFETANHYYVYIIAGMAGALFGGFMSDIAALIGLKLSLSRMILLAMSGVGILFAIICAGSTKNAIAFVTFIAIANAAYQSLLINLHASIAGTVSSRGIGVVVGIGTLFGIALAAGLNNTMTSMLNRHEMVPMFVCYGLMVLFGSVLALFVGWGLRATERSSSTS